MPHILPTVKRLIAPVALSTLLGACAAQMVWTKPGVTQAEWASDQYACERDTRMSAASFGNTYGYLSNTQKFYNKCLLAKGYAPIHKDDR